MADNEPYTTTWANLDAALRSLDHLYAEVLAPLKLNPIDAHILRVLYEQGRMKATDIAHAANRPPASFTPMLDKLEKAGLIERQPHPTDRRALHIYLTDEAKKLHGQIEAAFEGVKSELHQRLSPEELKTLNSLLEKLQKRPSVQDIT